jgi:uncharacterized protein YcfL
MKKILLIVFTCFYLVGCASNKLDVSTTKLTYVPLSADLTSPCYLTATLPDPKEYATLSASKKEYTLASYISDLLLDWTVCSNKVKAIVKEDKEKQESFK